MDEVNCADDIDCVDDVDVVNWARESIEDVPITDEEVMEVTHAVLPIAKNEHVKDDGNCDRQI